VFDEYVRGNCSAKRSALEKIIVNRAEQQRRLVIAARERGTLSVGEGGAVLGVSAWQARRLLAADQQRGIAVVVPGNRGRVPVNAVDEETRQAIIAFATERYVRFNQVHRRNTWASSKGSPAHGRACDAFLGQRGSAARARGARRHTAVGGHGSRVPGCACRLLPARTTGWKDAGHGGRCAWRLTGARWAGRRGKCWRCSAAPMTTAASWCRRQRKERATG